MHRNVYAALVFTVLLILLAPDTSAQNKTLIAKIDKADRFFLINDFAGALPLYLDLDKTAPRDALTNYRIGVCYFHSATEQAKALPFFEYALQHRDKQIPPRIHQYLGQLYHLKHRFDEAITAFSAYRDSLPKDDAKRTEAERDVQISRNAKALLAREQDVFIQNVGAPINTSNTEYGPVISADESILMYTSLKTGAAAKKAGGTGTAEFEDIIIAHKKDGSWNAPGSIGLNVKNNIGSVGLSPDGQHLLIYMGGQTKCQD
jgi:tetratricopeptide (TPR) repeat protein